MFSRRRDFEFSLEREYFPNFFTRHMGNGKNFPTRLVVVVYDVVVCCLSYESESNKRLGGVVR